MLNYNKISAWDTCSGTPKLVPATKGQESFLILASVARRRALTISKSSSLKKLSQISQNLSTTIIRKFSLSNMFLMKLLVIKDCRHGLI